MRASTHLNRAIAAAALVATAIATAGCGSSNDTSDTTQSPPAAPATKAVTISIADFKFKPDTLTVAAGATVTWKNVDTAEHTATAADRFDTGTIEKGGAKKVTLTKPGTYHYICDFHPFMKATIVVK